MKLTLTLCLQRLPYLSDIMTIINKLRVSVPAKTITILSENENILSLLYKTEFWRMCTQKRLSHTHCFLTLHDLLTELS